MGKKYENNLSERLLQFAIDVILYLRSVKNSIETIDYRKQLLKASASSGANYEEAQGSPTKPDAKSKIGISLKEMREANFFLRIFNCLKAGDFERCSYLVNESSELKRILASILNKLGILLFVFFLGLGIWDLEFGTCFAQTEATSEDDVKKNANEFFSNGEYASALPLYSQLLSLYPKDPNYSYRFGACKLFAEKDKESPLTYLEFGAADPNVEPEAYFFLGKAYHMNYRFDDALAQYKKFQEKGEEKSKQKLLLERHIAMCESGKKLLKNITDLVVMDKKTLGKEDYFRNYDLNEFGGKIIKTPDEFKLAYDIKKKKESIMYLQPNADVVYFSSYGEEGKNGKDIYFAKKTPDGNWGLPQILPGPVNTEFDEDFPFIHPDGKTMYFASNGHNSMGGYDIFKSEFDESTQQFSYPQNLDFAVSTPGDDYLYITDMEEKNAYFSSTRECGENEVTVYRVKVDRIPVNLSIITGKFICDATKSAKITVEDLTENKIAGVFSTNSNTGDYVLTLPNGGKFKFLVERAESPITYSGNVDIPRQKTLRQLKQEMQLVSESGIEKLIIKNLFDEEVAGEASVLLAEIFKEKAALDVNIEEVKLDTAPETKPVVEIVKPDSATTAETPVTAEETKPSVAVKSENISNEEIIKIAKDDAKNLQKEASEMRLEKDIAYSIANEKNRISEQKAKESEGFITQALYSATNPSEKQQKLDEAKKLKKESKLLAEQAVAAYNIAREIEKTANEKQQEADIAFNYAQELENAIQQNSPEATAEKLAQLNQFMEKQKQDKPEIDYQKQIEEKKKEAEIQTKLAEKLQADAASLEKDVSVLKEAAKSEKKKKDRERLEEQASLLERDLPAMQSEAQTANENAEKAQKELADLEKQESIRSSVVTQIKGADKTAVASLNESDKTKLETDISSSQERITKLEEELKSDTTSSSEQPLVSIKTTETNTDSANSSSATETTAKTEVTDSTKSTVSNEQEEQIPADYENYFKQKIESNETETNPVKKEENKAKHYENWARSMEKESSELKQKAEQTSDETEKTTLTEKATTLENSAKERRMVSQESQATAAQLRLNATAETSSSSSTTSSSSEIASYAEKYISTEKNALNIQNEKDKNVTLAEINKEWANEISKEITTLQSGADTISDETKKEERRETIRLLEELKKEKEQKAQQYTEKAIETPAASTSETSFSSIENEQVPDDYNTHFENKIKEQEEKKVEQSDSQQKEKEIIVTEETKAAYYESWAKSIDKEIQQVKAQTDTISNEEEKRSAEEKIAKLEIQKKEKHELATQSREQANQLKQTATVSSSSSTDTTSKTTMVPVSTTERVVSLQDQIFVQKMDSYKKQSGEENKIENKIQEEEFKTELYNNWSAAIDKDVQQLKVLRDLTESEPEKQQLDNLISESEKASRQKKELAKQSQENSVKLKEESANASPEISEEQIKSEVEKTEASVAVQQADSLQSEATLKKYQASKMGFFKKKKKAALLDEALKVETESEINREKSELGTERANLISQSAEVKMNEDLQPDYTYVKMEKKARSLESDAAYLDDQAKATKDSLAIVKKKKLKNEIFARANALEQKAAAKRTEAEKFTALSSELKTKEETKFKEMFLKTLVDAEKNDSVLPFAKVEMDSTEMETLKENEVQKNFSEKRKEYKKLYLQVEVESIESEKMRNEAGTQLAQFSSAKANLDTIKEKKIREQYIKDALEFASQARAKLATADSLNFDAQQKENLAGLKTKTAIEELYSSNDFEMFRKIYAYQFLKPPDTIPPAVAVTDTVPKDTVAVEQPKPIVEETFTIGGNATVYDAQNPIPLNPKYPDGLIWQVQIGAFRNPIPQNLFKGFAPIMGVKVSDGITRYSAGMFKTFSTANSAKNEIVQLGYSDAFVVVYRDGQRISITDARKLIAQGLFPKDISVTPETTVSLGSLADGGNISGLYFTVQIGVYSKPATEKQLKGVQPVSSEKLDNGTTRYTSGVYNNFESATEAKNTIVQMGISDAFVTAYYNGKRITIAEARGLVGSGQPAVGSQQRNTGTEEIIPEKKPAITDDELGNADSETGIVFRVMLGAFGGNVPVNEAGAILDFTRKNSKQYADENGNTVYLAGMFKDFDSAEKLKNKAVASGLANAVVVAFKNGEKIDVEEAKKMSE